MAYNDVYLYNIHIYIYIFIYLERERDRQTESAYSPGVLGKVLWTLNQTIYKSSILVLLAWDTLKTWLSDVVEKHQAKLSKHAGHGWPVKVCRSWLTGLGRLILQEMVRTEANVELGMVKYQNQQFLVCLISSFLKSLTEGHFVWIWGLDSHLLFF